ncbi:SpoIIE family protein phosphatase [Streptomyces sp. NPDC001914]|uniref:SpoIIE family protein phosphatase n=1 Tax=Streptomyces sp. NPDC001914 TaxID=3364623 RepID=UPI0036C54F3B
MAASGLLDTGSGRDQFGETVFHLRPGDAVLLYTDGITEARDGGRGPLFGEDSLRRALAATSGADAARTLDRLWQEASEHSRGHAIDDTVLMLLRVVPEA